MSRTKAEMARRQKGVWESMPPRLSLQQCQPETEVGGSEGQEPSLLLKRSLVFHEEWGKPVKNGAFSKNFLDGGKWEVTWSDVKRDFNQKGKQ